MKGIFVIMDGCADQPCQALQQKTPLQFANTPNLDKIAKKSKIDYCYTVKEDFVPESNHGVLSLLGYDFFALERGAFEAAGLGIKVKNGDLAFRCNFATIDDLENRNILDRRAGRNLTTKESKVLAKFLNENIKLPFPFHFYAGIKHRGVLIIRGGFSNNITEIESSKQDKLEFSKSLDDEDDSHLSADLINSFVRQAFELLDKHPINIERSRKGLYSANVILCRGAENKPPKLKKLKGKWMSLGYFPLEIGISRAVGMDVFKFKIPKMKGIDVYDHLYKRLKKAIKYAKKMLKKNKDKYDYFYVHFKETDLPGHDNKPLDKVKMVELLDNEFFSFLKDFIGNKKLIITMDHTTACRLKAHTSDPVPVLLYPDKKERTQRFTEEQGLQGKKWIGKKLLEGVFFSK